MEPVFKEGHCQIWTGDFNALSKEDYSEEQWNNITGIRKQNRWELPKTDLTKKATLFLSNYSITYPHHEDILACSFGSKMIRHLELFLCDKMLKCDACCMERQMPKGRTDVEVEIVI